MIVKLTGPTGMDSTQPIKMPVGPAMRMLI